MKNKPWKKPELGILRKSKPEESVLSFCKFLPPAAGPDNAFGGCLIAGCGGDCSINVLS